MSTRRTMECCSVPRVEDNLCTCATISHGWRFVSWIFSSESFQVRDQVALDIRELTFIPSDTGPDLVQRQAMSVEGESSKIHAYKA